jgi:hypothetical protein
MWDNDQCDDFAAAHKLAPDLAPLLRCTAEHVIARQDGGSDSSANIVAACFACNQGRHRVPQAPPSEAYRQQVRRCMSEVRWHETTKKNSDWLRALARLSQPAFIG